MTDQIAAFADRVDAGRQLANDLCRRNYPSPIVLALPRGGVAVGYEIAHRLHAPLDIVAVRKLGAPHQPELAIGAIAPGGIAIVDESAVRYLDIDDSEVDAIIDREAAEMWRREALYRGGMAASDLSERTALVVDDGLATGLTAEAAVLAVRHRRPAGVVLAIPVCAPDTRDRLKPLVDDIVCLFAPPNFRAVGIWYQNFDQLTDEDVIALLTRARQLALGHDAEMRLHPGSRCPSDPVN